MILEGIKHRQLISDIRETGEVAVGVGLGRYLPLQMFSKYGYARGDKDSCAPCPVHSCLYLKLKNRDD